MKQVHIEKLADIIAKENSEHRMFTTQSGEFRLGGSTFATGTFEIVIHYEGKEVSCSGHMGRQYITMTQVKNEEIDKSKPCLKINITRRNGAFIKNDRFIKNDVLSLIEFFNDWTAEVTLDNK